MASTAKPHRTVINNSLRYIAWSEGGISSCTSTDLPSPLATVRRWARKCDAHQEGAALDALETRMLGKQLGLFLS